MRCYAIRVAWRLMHNPNPKIAKKFEGTVHFDSKGELNWTGRINFDEDILTQPLRWKKPRMIFVNSLSDFFHPNVKSEWIDAAFAVMAQCPQHTFQVLTKHPERAVDYFANLETTMDAIGSEAHNRFGVMFSGDATTEDFIQFNLPLPNVWIITSAENQPTFDERVHYLHQIPAAVRGLSLEPLLGPINIDTFLYPDKYGYIDPMAPMSHDNHPERKWVICGGESGVESRSCDVRWIEGIIGQCNAAGVACYVKQLGASPSSLISICPIDCQCGLHYGFKSRKGGDPGEWKEGLNVRQFPTEVT